LEEEAAACRPKLDAVVVDNADAYRVPARSPSPSSCKPEPARGTRLRLRIQAVGDAASSARAASRSEVAFLEVAVPGASRRAEVVAPGASGRKAEAASLALAEPEASRRLAVACGLVLAQHLRRRRPCRVPVRRCRRQRRDSLDCRAHRPGTCEAQHDKAAREAWKRACMSSAARDTPCRRPRPRRFPGRSPRRFDTHAWPRATHPPRHGRLRDTP